MVFAILGFLMAWLSAGAAFAANDADRRLGIGLAEEGRCEAALEVLARVQAEAPADEEVARLLGTCALRLQDFRRAIASLETARDLNPDATDVDLLLAMAYYHSGRIDDAAEALVRAGAVDGDRAEFLLYSGLVAYAQSDYRAAAGRLDAASQLSEAPVEPMASFFLGRAELGAREDARARAAFERVVRDHPGTPWSEEATRALEEMDEGEGIAWWANAELGYEYDDNPLLRGRGVGRPQEISSQNDHRAVWFVDAGATLFEGDGISGGGMLRYAGSEHHDLERFDTHAPGATLWLDRELGVADVSIRVQYDFDATYIDARSLESDPFVISHLVGASAYVPWEDGMFTVVGVSSGVDDYKYEKFDIQPESTGGPLNPCFPATGGVCGPVRDEKEATDRDGVGVSANLLHHVPLPIDFAGLSNAWLEGEYRYQRYWSEGSEYDHQRHQVEIGFGLELPLEIGFRVRGRYAYAPYGNPSVFPDPSDQIAGQQYFLSTKDRREHETGVQLTLERAIGEHFVLATRYSRTRNRSNADVFDYSRDVFGISIRVGLGG